MWGWITSKPGKHPGINYSSYCGCTWLCHWLWNIIFLRLRICSRTTEFTERRLLSYVPRQSETLFLLYQPLLPCLFLHLLSWASGKLKKQVYLRHLSKEQRNHRSCFTQSSVLVCNAKLFRGTEKEASSGHQNFTSALQEHSKFSQRDRICQWSSKREEPQEVIKLFKTHFGMPRQDNKPSDLFHGKKTMLS